MPRLGCFSVGQQKRQTTSQLETNMSTVQTFNDWCHA